MANKKLAKDVADNTNRTNLKKSDAPKKSHKKSPNTGSASDARQKPNPRTPNRGIGSSFAYAVENVMGQSETREEGFLGVPDKLLNPRKYVDSEMMYKGKGKKLKQGDDNE